MVFNFMWTIHKEQNPQINKRFVQIAPDIEENEHLQEQKTLHERVQKSEGSKHKIKWIRFSDWNYVN